MNDQQPAYSPPTLNREPAATSYTNTKEASIKVPLILMVWPAVAFVIAILLYATMAYLTGQSSQEATSGSDDALFASQNVFTTIFNVVLFLIGSSSVVIGPISFVTGLVLLVVRLNERKKTTA